MAPNSDASKHSAVHGTTAITKRCVCVCVCLCVCVCVLVTQLCLTLCDPLHSSVYSILKARILECIAISFSTGMYNLILCMQKKIGRNK